MSFCCRIVINGSEANIASGLQIKDLDILSSIQNDLTEARDDRRREKIIRWLSKGLPDPSVEHNAKREQHVEGTGQWLIESKEFRSWMECNNSCIWLNGGREKTFTAPSGNLLTRKKSWNGKVCVVFHGD